MAYQTHRVVITAAMPFLKRGEARLIGSWGFWLAMFMNYSLPGAQMFALMVAVISPDDIDFVWTSSDATRLEEFMTAIGVARGKLFVTQRTAKGNWVTPDDKAIGRRFKHCCVKSAAAIAGFGVTLRITKGSIFIHKVAATGGVRCDVHLAESTSPPTKTIIDWYTDLDVTTLGVKADPPTVIARWATRRLFAHYYDYMQTDNLDVIDVHTAFSELEALLSRYMRPATDKALLGNFAKDFRPSFEAMYSESPQPFRAGVLASVKSTLGL